jgi:ABC-type microcin C transport system permease subunit YejE
VFSSLLLNAVGSLVGVFIGAFMGMSTESGMLRGAGVGVVSGAVFSIEAVESCIEIWRSSESGKYSIIFVVSVQESKTQPSLFTFVC